MLTSDGQETAAALWAGHLEGGSIEVAGPDGQTAVAPIQSIEVANGELVARAEFGSSEANFEWTARTLLDPAGLSVDTDQTDMGRKAEGAIWTLEIRLKGQ